MSIKQFELEELACRITGLDYDKIDADNDIIDERLYNEFNIDLEVLTRLINKLLPLIDVGRSPITSDRYKGFSDQRGMWYCKETIK